MPWVIWDILVPMLATFLIGLGTGWLLWRWRRQKGGVAANASLNAAKVSTQDVDGSVNTVLIEERDKAVARADAAEGELETLKGQIDLSVMGVETEPNQVNDIAGAADQQASEQAESKIESLTRQLEKEKASKADVEQSLVDLNTRYKSLSVRLEDEISSEDADTLKEAAALESDFQKAKETIAEQETKLKQLRENEQTSKQKYEQDIALKDAQLKQERAEREDVRMQLAREKLANESRVAAATENTGKPASDSTAVQNQPHKVHHLSGFSAGSSNESSNKDDGAAEKTPVNNNTERTASTGQTTAGTAGVQSSPPSSGVPLGIQAAPVSGNSSRTTTVVESSTAEELTPQSNDETSEDIIEDISPSEDAAVEKQPEAELNPAMAIDQSARPATADTRQSNEQTNPSNQNVTSISSRKPVAKKKKGTSTGYVPSAWSVPEKAPLKAERDDLQEIKGVGPVLEKMLHKTGIYHYRQVALLDKKGVTELDNQLPQFSGRIQREKWVQQAKTLHRAKYGSAAR